MLSVFCASLTRCVVTGGYSLRTYSLRTYSLRTYGYK